MRRFRSTVCVLGLVVAGLATAVTTTAAHAVGRQISSGGTASLRDTPPGDGVTMSNSEFANDPRPAESTAAAGGASAPTGPKVDGVRVSAAGPELTTSFNGLNHRQQRLANHGNQFSLEPPDQGLCAGNGFVLESVNDALRVYDAAGTPRSGVVDLNTFLGYPAEINRTTGVRGPSVTDPSCYFDPASQRWFHVVLTLDVNPASGALLGSNHLDVAVSTTASPLDPWRIYRLPVQDDGTQGTPNHHCSLNADGSGNGPCIGDYPHLGVDPHGVYLTTNEYSLNGPEYKAAQIYALDKAALVAGTSTNVVQFDTIGMAIPGFTIWPASAPTGGNESANHGTEYLMSGLVSSQPNGETPFAEAKKVAVWALTNTASLGGSPNVHLSSTLAEVQKYASPPKSKQKEGSAPLRDCINDTTMPTPFGPGCWQYLFNAEPAHDEVLSSPDSNDGRMQQVTYAGGRLYGALDSAAVVQGKGGKDQVQAASAWFVIAPRWDSGRLVAEAVNHGTVAVAGNNVNYPSIGVTASGKAIMAATLIGPDHFPSAVYVELRADGETSAVKLAAAGLGPDDGFTSYKAEVGDPPRTRYGDYGATAVVGNTVFTASEYIAQSCTLAQYTAAPFGSCGGTRTTLANWATRVSSITP